MSVFSASGGIPSGPVVLPDLRDLMALVILILDGRLVLMFGVRLVVECLERLLVQVCSPFP